MTYPRCFAFMAALLATSFSAAAADTSKGVAKPAPKPVASAASSSNGANASARRSYALPSGSRQAAVIIHGIQY